MKNSEFSLLHFCREGFPLPLFLQQKPKYPPPSHIMPILRWRRLVLNLFPHDDCGTDEQGPMRPPYPLQQGHRPCTRSAMQQSAFPSVVPHDDCGTDEQGPMRPPYPRQQGDSPCTRSAIQKAAFPNIFPHVAWGTKLSPRALRKRRKSRWRKLAFSPGLFLSFSPDAQHPVGGVPPPSPWAAVPHPTRKVTIFLLQRGFCVCSAGIQLAKLQSFFCKNVCACCSVSPANCSYETN